MVISQYIQNVKVNVTTEDVSVATTPKTDGPYVKVNTQPVTYTGSGIAVYTPIGTLDPSEMLSKTPEGFKIGDVINVSKEFTTDRTFVEGEGKTYPVGTNIVVVEHDGRKAFDVLGGFIDLTDYPTISQVEQFVTNQLAGKLDIIQPSANTRYVYSTHYSAVTSQNPQPLAISTGNATVNSLPLYIKVDNPAFDLPIESQKATFLVATPLYNAQCANKAYVDQFGIEIVR